jgi:hypothetical protein
LRKAQEERDGELMKKDYALILEKKEGNARVREEEEEGRCHKETQIQIKEKKML